MYQIELSEAALTDLDDFSPTEVEEIFAFLLSLAETPRPAGVQAMPLPEAAGEVAYLYETELYSIFYEVVEEAGLVRVVAIFKKISLN
jgi:plasmid stabilization system protein ParE